MNPALVNVEAERSLLGRVLLDSGCLYRTLPLLEAQDFSLDSHRRIFHVIAELAESGKPVDDLTVTDALIAKGQRSGTATRRSWIGSIRPRSCGSSAWVTPMSA